MNVLVTGGAGFIGANFVRRLIATSEDRVVNLDLLTYAGNLENLAGLEQHPRYRFVRGDIDDRQLVRGLLAEESVEAVVHFAAESHVDRSLDAPRAFLQTNLLGTQTLLEEARQAQVARFLQVSTDEVYGSLGPAEAPFTETSPLAPNSPYAASKAAADCLCRAYHHTYGFPVLVTRCSNNYGPYQFPEKLIPLMIANALEGKPLPIYGDGQNVRDWLYVADHCAALELVLRQGAPGAVYNIGGGSEQRNLDLVKLLLNQLGQGEELISFVADRPGHDRRYAIDAGKLRRELGWAPVHSFADGLAATVQWYLDHRVWWEEIRSGDYRQYYDRHYGPGGRYGAPAAEETP
jgi:dTDP-glucose 4,6-dehydratase